MLTTGPSGTAAPSITVASGDEATLSPTVCPEPAAKPFDLEFVTISRREHVEPKFQARQFQSLHSRALERMKWQQLCHEHELALARAQIAQLQADLALARAQNRDLRQRVFGAKTEQSRSVNALPLAPGGGAIQDCPRRPRGQQPGRRGHGRTVLPNLDGVVDEVRGTTVCPLCGVPAAAASWGSDDAQVIEIEVKAYRRIVRRQRMRPGCGCGCLPGLMAAPAPLALWPRSKLGLSIWVELLLSKFLYSQPTARLLQDWHERGLTIAQGTVTEGLRRLAPLFEPIMAACLDEVRRASHWHADETRWEVFEDLPGKTGHRWYLWVFKSEQAVCFVMDPSRSAAVPARTLAGAQPGILSVDRYAAYRKFARGVPGTRLALCWAHQRRDFLRVANDYPALWNWATHWVQCIGELYELHRRRRAVMRDPTQPAVIDADAKLRVHVLMMQQRCDAELADAQLAASLLSALHTMRLWAVNPRTWLQAYLQACAHAGGKPPDDIEPFLPWRMEPAQLTAMRRLPTMASPASKDPTT